MNKVVHFEIPADDTGRAGEFYHKTFGWKLNPFPEMHYTVFHTAPTDDKGMLQEPGSINGGMMERSLEVPNPVITISVDDIDEALKQVHANGGEMVREKTAIGEMGFVAYFKDTEGNVMGLWQNKV